VAVAQPIPYTWTPTSQAFLEVLRRFIDKRFRILEIGSSTGHISFRLAQDRYRITLLDIRKEAIEEARRKYETHGVPAQFIHEDIFSHRLQYDFAWNSGLIQCLDEQRRISLLQHVSKLTTRLLLFYPDTDSPKKTAGTNEGQIPGVGDAREYSVATVPIVFSSVFGQVHFGRLPSSVIGLPFDMLWIYGQN
jgi:SAM-dependent methyltransferase